MLAGFGSRVLVGYEKTKSSSGGREWSLEWDLIQNGPMFVIC